MLTTKEVLNNLVLYGKIKKIGDGPRGGRVNPAEIELNTVLTLRT